VSGRFDFPAYLSHSRGTPLPLEGFSNDFAHWAYTDLNVVGLGERLARLDVREFTSLSALRSWLIRTLEDFIEQNPNAQERKAENPFYFCSSKTVILPTQLTASDLAEFIEGWKQVSVHAGVGQTLEVVLVDRLRFRRCRPKATKLRTDAETGRGMATD
jgi:hypothetical protein